MRSPGPPGHEVATADLVGWNALMHRMPPGRAVGGSGALTVALAERLRRLGGTVRLGDGATAITRTGDRVTGVTTSSGEHLPARAVVAGCHVLTTLELLGDAALLARATTAVRVGNGIGMVVRLGTNALPRYPSAAGASAYSAMQLLAPSRTHLRAAHGEFTAGRTPTEPAVLLMTFSALDPTIAPAGKHNISAWAQWHPYELSTGEQWDDIRDREADKIVAQVEKAAPGFASSIEQVHVQTPLDLERELGLRRGNVMHVEMGLDSMFAYRPLPELAGYRTPVRGLFLTGASTHPGGGVFGASGRTAARVVLAQRRKLAMSSRRLRRAQQPPTALGCGRRPDLAVGRYHSRARDRLPAGRRSVAAPRHRSPLWCLSPRPACCTRWCTAASAGRSGWSSSPRAAGWRPRRSVCAPGCRSATTRTPARSAPRCSTCRWSCRWPGR